MEPIKAPKTIRVYNLVKQTGMTLVCTGSGTAGLGVGFFSTQQEAEHNRTLEVLRDASSGLSKPKFHVFELEIPNPAYKE